MALLLLQTPVDNRLKRVLNATKQWSVSLGHARTHARTQYTITGIESWLVKAEKKHFADLSRFNMMTLVRILHGKPHDGKKQQIHEIVMQKHSSPHKVLKCSRAQMKADDKAIWM